MSAYDDWYRELTAAAVLGTDRRPPPSPPSGLAPPTDLGGSADADAARALLDQAAIGAALARGGRTAGHVPRPPSAPPETLPYAPESALQRLRILLDVPPVPRELRSTLLLRWLHGAADRSLIVPPEFIPAVSALVTGRADLRAALAAVWGERGRWLAPHLGPSAVEASVVADTVPLRERWAHMPARAKEQALRDLDVTGDDEQFLEACLDERGARVRDAARDQLTSLVSSRYAQRMAARLAQIVDVERSGRRLLRSTGLVIRVHMPTVLDDAAARDGLAGADTDGHRADSMRAIVRSAPLATWTSLTGCDPVTIVRALAADTETTSNLCAAAVRQRDTEWAAALVAHSGHRGFPGLVETLSPADREADVLSVIPTVPDAALPDLLRSAQRPWSIPIANAVLDRLAAPSSDAAWESLPHLPIEFAADFPAAAMPRTRTLVDAPPPESTKAAVARGYQRRSRFLHAAITFHSFDRSIQEGFA